jgi:hypothetical protein
MLRGVYFARPLPPVKQIFGIHVSVDGRLEVGRNFPGFRGGSGIRTENSDRPLVSHAAEAASA